MSVCRLPSSHLLLLVGVGLCVAIYIYLVYTEVRRTDARVDHTIVRVSALREELLALDLRLTAVEEAHAQGCGGVTAGMNMMPLSMLFGGGHVGSGGMFASAPGPTLIVEMEEDVPETDCIEVVKEGDLVVAEDESQSPTATTVEVALDDPAHPSSPTASSETETALATPSEVQLKGAKVEALRALLRERGMDTTGTKDVLVSRLVASPR